MFVAPSTLHHKSTGFSVGRQLLTQAGLEHLLLPEMQIPESLVIELGLQQPPTFNQWPKDAKSLRLIERSFAAQRSLWLDEASRLFDSFSRDYTAALRTLVLQLYDRKYWICFGQCNTQGDAIDWLRQRHRLDFGAACRELRAIANILPAKKYGCLRQKLSRQAGRLLPTKL